MWIGNPDLEYTKQRWKSIPLEQRYTEITHDPLLFSVAQGIFWLSTESLSVSTLHLKEGGERSLYSCTLLSGNHDVLHRPLCADGDKIPKGWTSTYILHLSDLEHGLKEAAQDDEEDDGHGAGARRDLKLCQISLKQ